MARYLLSASVPGGTVAGASSSPLNEVTAMLLTIAIVLIVLWLLGFLAFKVTATAIHLILIIAVIALVMHFVRGKRPV
jgi:hypothetical protein